MLVKQSYNTSQISIKKTLVEKVLYDIDSFAGSNSFI